MTNKERQQSIANRYATGKEKRGKALWCEKCPHRISVGGCRIKIEKANEQCLCATAYNRCVRRNNNGK